MVNIFKIPNTSNKEEEYFEDILHGKNIRLERIISEGQSSPEGFWYNQEKDEWVVLLKGNATLKTKDENGLETLWNLNPGDSIFLKANHKHRVEKTSVNPKAIWLAVHGDIIMQRDGTD